MTPALLILLAFGGGRADEFADVELAVVTVADDGAKSQEYLWLRIANRDAKVALLNVREIRVVNGGTDHQREITVVRGAGFVRVEPGKHAFSYVSTRGFDVFGCAWRVDAHLEVVVSPLIERQWRTPIRIVRVPIPIEEFDKVRCAQ
jgi:hypothetical protein